MQIDNFILGDILGKGTFGQVKVATHSPTGEKVAIKILSKLRIKENQDEERITREINILKKMMHPNITQLYSVIESKTHLYLIMEYCEGGELFNRIVLSQRLSEPEACKFFHQLISGVEYLHKYGIVHRDLKPENLLLHKAKLKIVDFGLSNIYKPDQKLETACGSPSYAAPEMILGEKYEGLKVDIWSCGIILYAMVCGSLPFDDQNGDILFKKIVDGKFVIPSYISSPLRDLIIKILKTDPKKRISLEGIKSHHWMGIGMISSSKSPGLLVGKQTIPVDMKIVDELIEMNISKNREEIIEKIRKNKHDAITTSYYLCVRKKMNEKKESISDFGSKIFIDYISNYNNNNDSNNLKIINVANTESKDVKKESLDLAKLNTMSNLENKIIEDNFVNTTDFNKFTDYNFGNFTYQNLTNELNDQIKKPKNTYNSNNSKVSRDDIENLNNESKDIGQISIYNKKQIDIPAKIVQNANNEIEEENNNNLITDLINSASQPNKSHLKLPKNFINSKISDPDQSNNHSVVDDKVNQIILNKTKSKVKNDAEISNTNIVYIKTYNSKQRSQSVEIVSTEQANNNKFEEESKYLQNYQKKIRDVRNSNEKKEIGTEEKNKFLTSLNTEFQAEINKPVKTLSNNIIHDQIKSLNQINIKETIKNRKNYNNSADARSKSISQEIEKNLPIPKDSKYSEVNDTQIKHNNVNIPIHKISNNYSNTSNKEKPTYTKISVSTQLSKFQKSNASTAASPSIATVGSQVNKLKKINLSTSMNNGSTASPNTGFNIFKGNKLLIGNKKIPSKKNVNNSMTYTEKFNLNNPPQTPSNKPVSLIINPNTTNNEKNEYKPYLKQKVNSTTNQKNTYSNITAATDKNELPIHINTFNKFKDENKTKKSILNTSTINVKYDFEVSKSLEKNPKVKNQLNLSIPSNINSNNLSIIRNIKELKNSFISQTTTVPNENLNSIVVLSEPRATVEKKKEISSINKSQPATKREKILQNNRLKLKGLQPPITNTLKNTLVKAAQPNQKTNYIDSKINKKYIYNYNAVKNTHTDTGIKLTSSSLTHYSKNNVNINTIGEKFYKNLTKKSIGSSNSQSPDANLNIDKKQEESKMLKYIMSIEYERKKIGTPTNYIKDQKLLNFSNYQNIGSKEREKLLIKSESNDSSNRNKFINYSNTSNPTSSQNNSKSKGKNYNNEILMLKYSIKNKPLFSRNVVVNNYLNLQTKGKVNSTKSSQIKTNNVIFNNSTKNEFTEKNINNDKDLKKELLLKKFIFYIENQKDSTCNNTFDLSSEINVNILVMHTNLKRILKDENVPYKKLNEEWTFFCSYKNNTNFEIEYNGNGPGHDSYQISWIKFRIIEGDTNDFRYISKIIFERLFL